MKKFLLILAVLFLASGYCFSLPIITPEAASTKEAVKTASTEAKASPTTEAKPVVKAVATAEAKAIKIKFSDVPDDHWATSSVYSLVNMGVTQGYPDGTFRGNNNITRYETAVFISKLAAAIEKSGDQSDIANEKIKDDIRAEIRALRADIAQLKQMPEENEKPFYGLYTAKMLFGNLAAGNTSVEGVSAPVGPLVRYRLQTTFTRSISDTVGLKVNIDTMDSGFGGGSSDLSTRILDVEGDIAMNIGLENPLNVIVTSGPGPQVHTEEADSNGNFVARSENGVVYVRPWNSIMFSTNIFGTDMRLGYIARVIDHFGEVQTDQYQAAIGYIFPGLFFVPSFRLNTTVDYLANQPQSDPAGPTDTKYTFDSSGMIAPKIKLGWLYSMNQEGTAPHNSMAGLQLDLLDVWNSGTLFTLKYKKVGKDYLHEDALLAEDLFAGLDVFNRYIGSGEGLGVVDVDGELTQTITDTLRAIVRFDYRLTADNKYDSDSPQCGIVTEGGIAWNLATDTEFDMLYRAETIPSAEDKSTDLLQLSLSYKF
jgi:hypothetical protein